MRSEEMPAFMEQYLKRMKDDEKKDSYIKKSRSDLRSFQKWGELTNNQPIDLEWLHQLHKEDYREFVSWISKTYSERSVNRIGTVITKLLESLDIKNDFNINNLADTPKSFPLKKKDFVTDREYKLLLKSFQSSQSVPDLYKTAHNQLANRNISILYLMRFYGLTPAQISRISMEDINFTHNELRVDHDGHTMILKLLLKHKRQIYKYHQEIPEDRRPYFQTDAPLFVAFNNSTMTFQIDNKKSNDKKVVPQRLAERSIMKLLQVEIGRAGIRQVSSTHLRNRAILDAIEAGMDDKKVMQLFGITYPKYLNRFKGYISREVEES
jgi:site-specific recombinase XerD